MLFKRKILELQNVRMPFPWENVPRVCLNCGYRGYEKDSKRISFWEYPAIKCPKCGKTKFVRDPAIKF